MTEERPDDAREPDETAGPTDGDDGLEAQRASDTDAPFHGLRSAADIFGAPRGAEDWPSRRERREAERTARETGAPLPEPFEAAAEPTTESTDTAAPAPASPEPYDDGATQAISMPEQLSAPTENPQASAEHERATLGERIPPPAVVPPTSTAPHPSSIVLPTAQAHRDARAAEIREIEAERRRVDPFGQGRSDVDWLGRATGSQPTPTGPVAQQPPGVENALPSAEEPPSFTELLRLGIDDGDAGKAGDDRPFDWAVHDDDAGEVPTALTADAFDTALAAGSWSLAAEPEAPAASAVPAASVAPLDDETASDRQPAPFDDAAVPVTEAIDFDDRDGDQHVDEHDGDQHVDGRVGEHDEGDVPEPAPRLQADEPTTALPTAGSPAWSEADVPVPPAVVPPAVVPPTAAVPPLVEPEAEARTTVFPTPLPPAVGQDLDAVTGIRGADTEPEPLPAAAPDDLDQSEWDGRETSDTSAIKDLFGTEAVGQLGGTGYDPHDTGTRAMPAMDATTPAPAAAAAAAPAPARAAAPTGDPSAAPAGPERDNFINEGFAKLRNEGKRGKLLLIWGSVAIIVVLLVAVFALTTWILGNSIDESAPAASSTSAASAPASKTSKAPSTTPAPQASAAPSAALPALQFATTPATPGEHSWTELAGGECLSPFTNAWSQTFTVVDCATPHIAQLTARLPVSANAWPGPDALAAQAAEQCQTAKALDTAAAAAVGDVQVQGSYAPDQATWDQGDTFISCFVTRSSGQTLTASLAPGA